MTAEKIDRFRQKLADLDNLPETSFALRCYLKSAIERDVVDVINEIDLLARILSDYAPEKWEP